MTSSKVQDVLQEVHYLHELFAPELLESLEALRCELPGDSASQNMVAVRRRFESEEIAARITESLPE